MSRFRWTASTTVTSGSNTYRYIISTNTTSPHLMMPTAPIEKPTRYEKFLKLVMEYFDEGYEIDIVTGGVIIDGK